MTHVPSQKVQLGEHYESQSNETLKLSIMYLEFMAERQANIFFKYYILYSRNLSQYSKRKGNNVASTKK